MTDYNTEKAILKNKKTQTYIAPYTKWGNIGGNITEQSDLQVELSNKQPILTAGSNIFIQDNVISASGELSARWGNLDGIITDQKDLQDELKKRQERFLLKTERVRSTLPSTADWQTVCYGKGKFVAIATDSNKVASSSDGITWQGSSMPLSDGWFSVCYGNGKFVAVAYRSNKSAYSFDGVTWVESTMPSTAEWRSVCYGNGRFVAVTGVADNNKVAYSIDGRTWIEGVLPSEAKWQTVCYGNGKFVVVSADDNKVAYSTNGITWSETTLPTTADWFSVCYGKDKFVAVAYNSNKVASSFDGITWIEGTLPLSDHWYSVCYGDGKFVVVAWNENNNKIVSSEDGITWVEGEQFIGLWSSICYGNDKFVAVGYERSGVAYSYNGINWGEENIYISGVTEVLARDSIDLITSGAVYDELEWKQEKLIAGNGIKIKNDVISYDGFTNPIGSIIPITCANNYIPQGYLPCNNTEYSKSQFNDLWTNYLTNNKLMTCTYAEYNSDIATYGKCGKWAIDTANQKFKTPFIPDGTFIQQAQSGDELGKSYKAGLPNITGRIGSETSSADKGIMNTTSCDGAFTCRTTNKKYFANSSSSGAGPLSFDLDASISSEVYGNSETVQPNAVALRYFVCVANGEINQSQMDWSAWASGLNNKANNDLSNVTVISRYITQSYQNGNDWWEVYNDGWVRQGGKVNNNATAQNNNISLLKPFANTNYTVTVGMYAGSSFATGGTSVAGVLGTVETNSFNLRTERGIAGAYWIAEGQGVTT